MFRVKHKTEGTEHVVYAVTEGYESEEREKFIVEFLMYEKPFGWFWVDANNYVPVNGE